MLIDTVSTEKALAAIDWRSAAEEAHNCYDAESETPGVAWLDARTGDIQFAEAMQEIDGLVALRVWDSMELEGEEMGRRSNTPTKVVKFALAPWLGTVELGLLDRIRRQVEEYCESAGW